MNLDTPPLGILVVSLTPQEQCIFPASPARSLRAALLPRLELLDPDLSRSLHDAQQGAALRPWTISPLLGPLARSGDRLVAAAGQTYQVRITALAPRVLEVLNGAFLSDHPLAGEPLVLEQSPFYPLAQETRWEGLTSYPSLLTYASPRRRIGLRFRSPTGFRRRDNARVEPAPGLCITGYVRKWNAFFDVSLPEGEVLDYVRENVRVAAQELRPANFKLGQYAIPGIVGSGVGGDGRRASPAAASQRPGGLRRLLRDWHSDHPRDGPDGAYGY